MNYILPTHQSDPEATTDIDFAIIKLDEKTRQRLVQFKQVRDHADIMLEEGAHPELVWFNYWASYYGFYSNSISLDYEEESSFEGMLDQALADSSIMEATDEELSTFGLDGQRTEMDEIHVCWDGVYWTCNPRHLDTQIMTEILTWERLGIE